MYDQTITELKRNLSELLHRTGRKSSAQHQLCALWRIGDAPRRVRVTARGDAVWRMHRAADKGETRAISAVR